MRINSQSVEGSIKAQVPTQQQIITVNTPTADIKSQAMEQVQVATTVKTASILKSQGEESKSEKEKVQEAVTTLNEFLQINHYSSKFVLHEGLDEYFVQLVDPQTDEVIKEIPPKKLLDSFFEMQKLAGVIVDEKI